jgi:[ribosomal protein S5]-alanine N-acetyltransferase
MTINCGPCLLRPWHPNDEARLSLIASDRDVSRYMTARFPYPYTVEAARSWIEQCNKSQAPTHFAIVVENQVAGGCGYDILPFERCAGAELGYWLNPAYWGRGIATAAFMALTDLAFSTTEVHRVQATIYSPNLASARVAEKCGYIREARLKDAVLKNGEIYDALIYARFRRDIKETS